MTRTAADIKTMKLYSQVDRILRDLEHQGHGGDAPLAVEQLTTMDQFHYFGTEAVDEAIGSAGINAASHVLDIGSGLGGPARWLAHRTGCHVTAVELQADMDETATGLTRRCGLSGQISHVCNDILATPLASASLDAAVSWLALYHIPGRAALFPRLHDALRPGGQVHIEDLYARNPLSQAEAETARTQLYANTMTSRDGYVSELSEAGFTEIAFADMSEPWGAFTADRLAAFRAGRAGYTAIHGEAGFTTLEAFYAIMADLFAGGNLGGVRLTARRP